MSKRIDLIIMLLTATLVIHALDACVRVAWWTHPMNQESNDVDKELLQQNAVLRFRLNVSEEKRERLQRDADARE